MNKIELRKGDCLELMKDIEDKSIDMILCDLPYGTTACKWDTIIPFDKLWEQYERIIKDNGAIVLFGKQPFTSQLILSNLKLFKYELIWEKTRALNCMQSKKQPLYIHENIIVFYKKQCVYNPIKHKVSEKYIDKRKSINNAIYTKSTHLKGVMIRNKDNGTRFPQTIIPINSEWSKNMHPTQKPVALFEYLIKTYTNENDLVLDNCAGSGTTGIACQNLNRNCIMIEKEEEYCNTIKERIGKDLLFTFN